MEKSHRYTPTEMALLAMGFSPEYIENMKQRRQMHLTDATELKELKGGRHQSRRRHGRNASKRNASKRNASRRRTHRRK